MWLFMWSRSAPHPARRPSDRPRPRSNAQSFIGMTINQEASVAEQGALLSRLAAGTETPLGAEVGLSRASRAEVPESAARTRTAWAKARWLGSAGRYHPSASKT